MAGLCDLGFIITLMQIWIQFNPNDWLMKRFVFFCVHHSPFVLFKVSHRTQLLHEALKCLTDACAAIEFRFVTLLRTLSLKHQLVFRRQQKSNSSWLLMRSCSHLRLPETKEQKVASVTVNYTVREWTALG